MSQASPNPFEPPGTYWRNEPDARPDGIQYLESYRYITRSPDWVLNVLFTLICQFIPLIGPIVLLGYQFQIVEELTRNPAAVYPRFSFDLFYQLYRLFLFRGGKPIPLKIR